MEVLNLPPGASGQEIRKVFKELPLQYHPDVNPAAKQRYERIIEAYEALKKEEMTPRLITKSIVVGAADVCELRSCICGSGSNKNIRRERRWNSLDGFKRSLRLSLLSRSSAMAFSPSASDTTVYQ